ncbi:MAG: CobW family GTP-binding protein [Rhizobiaceae bacterium]
MTDPPKPVHILSGFLGTGKTTLLNNLLKRDDFYGTLVIANEFGAVPLDHHLIQSSSETIVELSNGCLCCSIRGELVDTLLSLDTSCFDRIIIETTGIADPLPIHQAITAQPVLANGLMAGSIITVFDSVRGPNLIQDHPEAKRQLALADLVYLSMLDDGGNQTAARKAISIVAPYALIVTAQDYPGSNMLDGAIPKTKQIHSSGHSGEFSSLVLESSASQSVITLVGFLHYLGGVCGPSLLRVKGFANSDEHTEGPVLLQMSGPIVHDPVKLENWPDGIPRTQLTVIGKDIDLALIQSAFNGFFGIAGIDTPDRDALIDNPLSIPGV